MDDLQTLLDQLDTPHLQYVMERSKVNTDAAGYKAVGVSKSAFYLWENRERLNELADRLRRERVIAAMLVLDQEAEHAARVKVKGLGSEDEKVQQAAATEILDRTVGKPVQHSDVTSQGERVQAAAITTVEVVKDYGESE